ncbi:MAG: ATP synthase F1 subunit epsilon [Lentisphaerae bacterium RIFOXYB12_FULL_65_16]|nr:MAG: ATP synthase F1 subunit epsilon [Lentisphaerae bacterium RIFOXYA12_64_32]OGV86541.1 MAG: ATP synthase F1 subunit epsilon [Lentisphaerae bacterium RIFOXYB12_FULL_65_16]
MPATMKLELVTPESRELTEEIEAISLPSADGEIMVYPGHVPLVTILVPGELTLLRKGKEEILAVGEGFVMVTTDTVAVVTDMAIEAASIDEAKAEEARQQAEKRLHQKLSDEEAATVSATLSKSLAQLNVKRRMHGR